MNSHEIEELLKRAPTPQPPPQLKQRLLSSISLPVPIPEPQLPIHGFSGGLKARWLGLAAGLVAVLLVGWGAVHTSKLTQRNQALTQSLQELQHHVSQNADSDRILNLQQEIERLRGQNRELHQLRAEVAALRPIVKEMETLRQEHQQLLEAFAQQQAEAATPPITHSQSEPWEEKSQSIACINNLKQIGLAARIWANDYNGVFPPGFLAMTPELTTPSVLHCPADHGRPKVSDWDQFHPSQSSYEYLNPGGDETWPMMVLARCRIHGHLVLSDGSVLDGQVVFSGERRLTSRNGRLEIEAVSTEPPQPPSQEYYERLMMERYGIIPGRPADPPPDEENEPQPSERFLQRYGLPPPEE
jgi:hypothetical protein